MRSVARVDPRRWLRLLVGIKLLTVLGLSLWYGWIRLGERDVTAAETAASKPSGGAGPAAGSADGGGKGAGDAGPAAASDPASGAPQQAAVRRSFLDDLLNLPAIDPDKAKKDEMSRFLAIADRKQQQIEERVKMLKAREDQLIELESSIDRKLAKLDEERKFFADTIQREKEVKGERLEKLIPTFEKMEPKKAAPILEKIDRDFAIAVFGRLPQKQLMKIVEAMPPETAVKLTEYYSRIKSAREYDFLKEMNTSLRAEFDPCKGMPTTTSAGGIGKSTHSQPEATLAAAAGEGASQASSGSEGEATTQK